jgi:predicted RNA-binding Zn-ribbon protein involved in translation (DUF1610 family)
MTFFLARGRTEENQHSLTNGQRCARREEARRKPEANNMKCPKCGKDMEFIKTAINRKTGKPADMYRCVADDMLIAVQKEA